MPNPLEPTNPPELRPEQSEFQPAAMAQEYDQRLLTFKNDLYGEISGQAGDFQFIGFDQFEAQDLLCIKDPEKISQRIKTLIADTLRDITKRTEGKRKIRGEQYRLLGQFRLLRELQNIFLEMQQKYSGQPEVANLATLLEVLQKMNREFVQSVAGFTNPEDFFALEKIGQPISRRPEEPLTLEQLALVRTMKGHLLDYDGQQLTALTPFQAGVPGGRNSLHFSLNHLVESHAQGSWEGAEATLITPLAEINLEQNPPTSCNEIDTFFYNTKIPLPPETILVITAQDQSWAQFLADHPEIEQRYHVLRIAQPEKMRAAVSLILEKMGYSCIQGGDYNSDDHLMWRKLDKFIEQTPALSKETRPHFFTGTEAMDDLFNLTALAEKMQPLTAADLYLLQNGDKKFDTLLDFSTENFDLKYLHLSSAERARLLRGLLTLFNDLTIKDLKMPAADYLQKVNQRSSLDHLSSEILRLHHSSARAICQKYFNLKTKADPSLRFLLDNASPDIQAKLDSWNETDCDGYVMEERKKRKDR